MLIVMIGVSLGELLNDIAGGRVPPGLLGTLIVFKLPEVLSTTVPLAIFIAVIWGLGRLYRDQEMAVMRASGLSWPMMLKPLFSLLLPVALVMFAVGVFVAPSAASATQEKLAQAFRNAAEWGLQAGAFHVLQGGDLVLYVEAVDRDGRTLRNIFIQQINADREQVWIAERGYYWLDRETGNRYLTLENGQITEGGVQGLDFAVMDFSRNDLKLPQPEEKQQRAPLEARSSGEILFTGDAGEAAEIQWRVSPAIAVLIMGLLAIPLSHSAPREGRGGRALLGVLAYIVYVNLLYMCRNWVAKGDLPASLGLWWVHLLVLLATLIWLRQQGRMKGRA